MDDKELEQALHYLIDKYILEASKREALRKEVDLHGSAAAKGLLHDFTEAATDDIDGKDSELIRRIAFYYA